MLKYFVVGFEVLTTVVKNVAIFLDIVPRSMYVNRRFGRTYNLNLQGRKSAEQDTSVQQVTRHNKPSAGIPVM
jgi:hypothetical protein